MMKRYLSQLDASGMRQSLVTPGKVLSSLWVVATMVCWGRRAACARGRAGTARSGEGEGGDQQAGADAGDETHREGAGAAGDVGPDS